MSGDRPAYIRKYPSINNNKKCVHCGCDYEEVVKHNDQWYCIDCYDYFFATVSDPFRTYNLKELREKQLKARKWFLY